MTTIKNYGITETQILNGKQKINNTIEWDADYNGEIVDINVSVNDNGNKQNIHAQLDNNDIMRLLEVPYVDIPLDNRLSMDYPLFEEKHIAKTKAKNKTTPIVLEQFLTPLTRRQKKRKNNTKKYRILKKNKNTKRIIKTYN